MQKYLLKGVPVVVCSYLAENLIPSLQDRWAIKDNTLWSEKRRSVRLWSVFFGISFGSYGWRCGSQRHSHSYMILKSSHEWLFTNLPTLCKKLNSVHFDLFEWLVHCWSWIFVKLENGTLHHCMLTAGAYTIRTNR